MTKLLPQVRNMEREAQQNADDYFSGIAVALLENKGDYVAQAAILNGYNWLQLREIARFMARMPEGTKYSEEAIFTQLKIRQSYKAPLSPEEEAAVKASVATLCWGCQTNQATPASENHRDMGLCETCLTGTATQARELRYEAQITGVSPSLLELAAEAEEAKEILRDRALYKLRGGKFLTIDVDLDAMVAEYNESDILVAQDEAAAARQQADAAQAERDALINTSLPVIQADARALFIARLYHAAAVIHVWIENRFPADYQAPQFRAFYKAFNAMRDGKLKHHVDMMVDGQHTVVFESQRREKVEHITTADGCSCEAGTQGKTCLHYPSGRILVLATLGIDPAGLLPVVSEVKG